MNPIREKLNEHQWKTKDLDSLTLIVRHRGAPNDEAFIRGSEIAEILPDGVQLAGDDDDAAFIPYHRILRIEGGRS